MQATDLRDGDDPSRFRWLDRARLWRVLVQRQVRASSMIIANEGTEVATQALLVEYNHVVLSKNWNPLNTTHMAAHSIRA